MIINEPNDSFLELSLAPPPQFNYEYYSLHTMSELNSNTWAII